MRRLAILGASGHGKSVADAALLSGWDDITFFDDAAADIPSLEHWHVAGTTSDLIRRADEFNGAIVAIGNNRLRLDRCRELLDGGVRLVSVCHPAAVISPRSHLGAGTVALAGSVLAAFASVDLGCILNTNCSVDHDCRLGAAVHVSPGARIGGAVSIGDRAWIGIGAAVIQCVEIGQDAVVGAGAAVIEDVAAGATVVGVPAKPV